MKLYHDDMVKLKHMFGHRAKFDASELRLYSQDVSNPPGPVKMMLKTTPDAVVLPRDEQELVDLIHFATERRSPLIPRGGGSAGYGGAMPVRGGIVVDLSKFDQTLKLHAAAGTATIGAGMTFLDAEARLNAHGKALCAMPTSAPMATIGGWIAQGGAGLGSLQYGWMSDLVESVRVVLPNGDVRDLADSELDVIHEMEGMTGFIVAATIKIRDAVPMVPLLATYPDVASLQQGVAKLRSDHTLWSMLVHNPEFTELRDEALGRRNVPKNQFSISMAAEADKLDKEALAATVTATGGKLLDDKKAADEWDLRFSLFAAKRLGPSMVPGEAVVPTKRIGEALANIRKAVRSDTLLMEGVVAGDETIWFCFSLDDERRKEFPAAFGAAVCVLQEAKRLGGRTLGTGVYLSTEAGHVFDDNRIERVHAFRRAVDRQGIMNPGKVFGTPIRFQPTWAPGPSLAQLLAPGNPVLKFAHGNSFVRYLRPDKARNAYAKGIDAALGAASGGGFGRTWAWDLISGDLDRSIRWASASARTFKSLGASPAGWALWAKDHAVMGGPISAHQWALLQGEGLASGADLASSLNIPWSKIFQAFKEHLIDQGFRPVPALRAMADHCDQEHNATGAPHDERTRWAQGLELPEKGSTLLFVDDTVSYERPEMAKRAVALLAEAGVKVSYLGAEEWSSAAVLLQTGQRRRALETVKHNIEAITKSGAKEVLLMDTFALHAMREDYPIMAAELGLPWNVKVRHVSEALVDAVQSGKLTPTVNLSGNVAVHDVPTLIVHGLHHEALRAALDKAGLKQRVELWAHGVHTRDLGVSGGVPVAFPEITLNAVRARLDEAREVGANHIVTACAASAQALAAEADAQNQAGNHEVPAPQVWDITEVLAGVGGSKDAAHDAASETVTSPMEAAADNPDDAAAEEAAQTAT